MTNRPQENSEINNQGNVSQSWYDGIKNAFDKFFGEKRQANGLAPLPEAAATESPHMTLEDHEQMQQLFAQNTINRSSKSSDKPASNLRLPHEDIVEEAKAPKFLTDADFARMRKVNGTGDHIAGETDEAAGGVVVLRQGHQKETPLENENEEDQLKIA